jgi:hypothetical protein
MFVNGKLSCKVDVVYLFSQNNRSKMTDGHFKSGKGKNSVK